MAIPWNAIITGATNAVGLFSSLFGSKSSNNSSAIATLSDQNKSDIKWQNAQTLANQKSYQKWADSQNLKNSKALMDYDKLLNEQLMGTSAKTTQVLNQNLMDYQYNLERQSRQTSFYDTKQDLLSAGYNPLLAVGQQSNYVPVSSGVQGDSATVENANLGATRAGILSTVAGTVNQTSATMSQNRRNAVLNSIDQMSTIANVGKTLAEKMNVNSSTVYQNLQNAITSATGLERANAEIDKIKTETNLSKKQIDKIQSDINTNSILNLLYNSERMVNNAKVGNIAEQTKSVHSANVGNYEFAKWMSQHPKMAGLYSAVNGFKMPTFGFRLNLGLGNSKKGGK